MSTPSLLNIPYRLKAGTLYSQLPETGAGDFTVSRTTTPTAGQSTRINSLGNIELVANNVPRLDYPLGGAVNGCPALLVEPSAVNLALHSRDLTQAAWVASGITPLRNAVGMDGAANTGTTLTATGANGTILQTLTHASQVRAFSAYVRRTVGTGTIEITTNGGTTWTPITLTSAYTRFSTTATVTNGQVGFRIVTSGDAIVVDYCQGEVGTVATSAIPTTTAAITRSEDQITRPGVSSLIGQTEGTFYFEGQAEFVSADLPMINRGVTNSIMFYRNPSNQLAVAVYYGGANFVLTTSTAITGPFKMAIAYKQGSPGDTALFVNGVQAGTTNTANWAFTAALTEVVVRSEGWVGGTKPYRVRGLGVYPNRIPNTAAPGVLSLATLTTP